MRILFRLATSVLALAIFHVSAVTAMAADTPAAAATSNQVKVTVTEKIPGAKCEPAPGSGSGVTTRKYTCTVEGGFLSVRNMLGGLIKYATFITALLGVLMVVFSGLQYATSAGDTKAQSSSVKRIGKLIGGLVLLFLMALILNTIAPWIYG